MLELDAKLKPFIPEYIPAVGEVDAFLKMPRPDGQKEELGLKVMVNISFI
jgi:intraflagellar transport protein 46